MISSPCVFKGGARRTGLYLGCGHTFAVHFFRCTANWQRFAVRFEGAHGKKATIRRALFLQRTANSRAPPHRRPLPCRRRRLLTQSSPCAKYTARQIFAVRNDIWRTAKQFSPCQSSPSVVRRVHWDKTHGESFAVRFFVVRRALTAHGELTDSGSGTRHSTLCASTYPTF